MYFFFYIRPHQVDCSSYGFFCKKILCQTPKKIKIKSGFQTLTVNVFRVKSEVFHNRSFSAMHTLISPFVVSLYFAGIALLSESCISVTLLRMTSVSVLCMSSFC